MGLDWPHVHLMINHFPIILAVMGAAAAVLALVRRWRGVWLYAVASLTLMGVSAYPTLFTGQEAEEALHRPWYIVRGSIQRHEEAAELALWIMIATGLIALYAWWRATHQAERDTAPPVWLRALVLIGALASVAAVARASWIAEEIVHGSPILSGPAPAGLPQPVSPGGPPTED